MTADADTALVVEDDEQMRLILVRMLESRGFACESAGTVAGALAHLEEREFDLAVIDIHLPDASGIELARKIRHLSPETAVLIESALGDPAVAELATDSGALGYLVKPFASGEFAIAVSNVIARRRAERESRRNASHLEREVRARTAELERAVAELARSREETIHRLARAIETRDAFTGGHIERIGPYAGALATELGMPAERVKAIELASPMHDIGKLGVRDAILLKPGPLDDRERTEIERHCEYGHQILAGSGSDLLELAAEIALSHHERYDGSGYPRGLGGEEIPVEGRIVAIADVFDALLSDRPYRAAMQYEQAVEVLTDGRGTQFDPALLDLFMERVAQGPNGVPRSAVCSDGGRGGGPLLPSP